MDTELVKRAQHGDREAFGLVAADLATRFLSVSRRILRDIYLAEDATQQALVAIWRDLPQLRDPARFDAWSYRLLVRACYAEGRRSRASSPNLRILPADEPSDSGGFDALANPVTPDWVLLQLLTAEQGLRAVTLEAAYALRDEARPPGARLAGRHHDPERGRHHRDAGRDPGHDGPGHDRERCSGLLS